MRNPKLLSARQTILTIALVAVAAASSARAQTLADNSQQRRPESSTVVLPSEQRGPIAVARESEMECAGFIEHRPASSRFEIVGAEQEQEQRTYAEGDYVYINGGAQQGVREGQEFAIIRPRGRFKTRFSRKNGTLGMYTQELGRLRVVETKQNVSVAFITRSCDQMLLGDLLREVPQRPAPVVRAETPTLDRFVDPTGKQQGRIVLARDGREVVAKDQIVFIDLGAEDNVRPGDYLTVYRRVGEGDISRFEDKEVAKGGSRGFESRTFRGGKYSISAQRVKDIDDGHYKSPTNTPAIESRRPEMPRKIVGEVVIISVEARTAAAIITRAAQEIFTGDFVEVQ
ncbi:MAG TPA: hypothetical protein VFX96_15470 [Pyrinomonadaceae bacterium]|nr:hypothetical protein [Pyrinomonadaceae bacterium]